MVGGLATALIVATLVVAAWCAVTAARNRPTGDPHLYGTVIVEVVLLAQVAVAVVKLARGDRPDEFATFIAYLVLVPFVLPIGFFLSLVERTRWGTIILGGSALALAILIVRLEDLWETVNG